MKKRKKRSIRRVILRNKKLFFGFILFLVIFINIFNRYNEYKKTIFNNGTIIYGVDCSKLTVEQSYEKLNKALATEKIYFTFPKITYIAFGNTFNLRFSNENILEDILEAQNRGENLLFDNSFKINEISLRNFLLQIKELKTENMAEPQNAYISVDTNNLLTIIPETDGSVIDFDEAYSMALNKIKNGNTKINFSSIIKVKADILSTDESLISQKEKINSILSTSITYILPDGSTCNLDIDTMKDWLYQKDDGSYEIELDSNIESFVESLSEKTWNANNQVIFSATGIGDISLNLPKKFRVKVDTQREISKIKSELGTSKGYNRSPVYETDIFSLKNKKSYVELDLSRQTVWLYINGECILETPCVTGNVSTGHSTPTGIFYLTYKETDTYLKGTNNDGSKYSSHVNFWMPFNSNIGFHDASWRSDFGGTIYIKNGSHGCVNLPFEAAQTLYNNITYDIPIIVYSS